MFLDALTKLLLVSYLLFIVFKLGLADIYFMIGSSLLPILLLSRSIAFNLSFKIKLLGWTFPRKGNDFS